MRSLSSDLRTWKDSQSRLVPLITLYDIEVSDSTTLRLVEGDPDGTGSVTFGGNTYNACAIEREEHTENVEGEYPSFRLVVSNVNGVAGGYIEQNELDGRQVTIRTGLLRGTEGDYLVETYTITAASYDRRSAVLTLGPPNFFKRKTCPLKFQRMRCQHQWGQRFLDDATCGYPSDTFEADSEQEMLPCTINTEKAWQFGWYSLNGAKCTLLNVGKLYVDMLNIATDDDEVEWEPGFLNAPFVYKKISGDFDVFTNVSVIQFRDGFFAGLLCQSVDDLTSWVYHGIAIDPGGYTYVRSTAAVAGVFQPVLEYASGTHSWVRLVRSGSTFTCSYSTNGTSWTSLGSHSVAMSAPVRIGLCLSAPRLELGEMWAGFNVFQFRSGGDSSCERTREACRLKGNVHRYGAFPGIPTLR